MEQQQILYVTGDEFEIQQLQEGEGEHELIQEGDGQGGEEGQVQIVHEIHEKATPENLEDVNLECEDEVLAASPMKLTDRARYVTFPLPDQKKKRGIDTESKCLLAELVNLPSAIVLERLRQLENLAQILGQQEMTELTRAEVLNIL